MKQLLFWVFALQSITGLYAQGINGTVKDHEGIPLPFASIYIQEVGTGTSSNADGYYELKLKPGVYQITFQYLGYAAQTKTVRVENGFKETNIILQPQSILLGTVTVVEGAEDPAYTIMRKAISKAKYHLLQTESYSAQVYTKGTGKVKKIPWGFRGLLEKEGVDTNRAFTSESISEVTFEQPNTFKERIISIRTSGENDQNASPNAYINSSFYEPYVVGGVSPLSPKAFRYYRFQFKGTFQDRNYIVNKIKVIPRSRGENVYEGYIYIRENYWNIHSLDLKTTVQGFDLDIAQIFGPVAYDIWMPVTQKYQFEGSFLGFEVVYNYLASLSEYQIVPNPDLSNELIVIDEKIEPVPEEVAENDINIKRPTETLKKDNKELTRKQLAKLIDEYEEQEFEETEEVVSDRWYEVDSLARKKDSAYWATVRPVPLSNEEIKGYKTDDSVYVVAQQDTLEKKNGSAFNVGDIFFGSTYKFGERTYFDFRGFLPELRYNTVEGVNLDFEGTLRWKNDSNLRLAITPNLRYGFASEQFYGKAKGTVGVGKYPNRTTFSLEGGKYINQFYDESIDPLVNSIWTLFFARNYMKLYEQDFASIGLFKEFGHKYQASAIATLSDRTELFNNTQYSFFRPGENWYSANAPQNEETTVGGFNQARALKTGISLTAKPWLKFRRYNGKKIPLSESTTTFKLTWNAGWNNALGSSVDYQQIELGVKTAFRIGVRASIDFDAQVGTFFSNSNMLFMDFKHFNGGLTEIAPLRVTGNYRLLDYYQYSTQQSYASLFTHIRFRKFLLTQLPLVRISGVKENLFVNYLKTDVSPHYVELGYTIDQIFRVFRLEFVQSFNGLEPYQFGIRIGVSSLIDFN